MLDASVYGIRRTISMAVPLGNWDPRVREKSDLDDYRQLGGS